VGYDKKRTGLQAAQVRRAGTQGGERGRRATGSAAAGAHHLLMRRPSSVAVFSFLWRAGPGPGAGGGCPGGGRGGGLLHGVPTNLLRCLSGRPPHRFAQPRASARAPTARTWQLHGNPQAPQPPPRPAATHPTPRHPISPHPTQPRPTPKPPPHPPNPPTPHPTPTPTPTYVQQSTPSHAPRCRWPPPPRPRPRRRSR
jgi:hypothetical protein